MKLSYKKDLYHRFLQKELNATELEEFFSMVEKGEFDEDYQLVMPDMDEKMPVLPEIKLRPIYHSLSRIAVAASLLLLAGFGYWAYRKTEQTKKELSFTTVKVPVGTLRILTLTDHSVITLTSGSEFRYPLAFTASSRKVFLIRGKAFFQVAKDKKRPFTVFSAKLSTTVLGTSFTVENYRDYGIEKIRLYTGKVKIGSREKGFDPVLLSPGQQYLHNTKLGMKSIFSTDAAPQQHTEDGSLDFDDTSLAEALIRVSSYYQIHLQFDQQLLKGYAISGKFSNEPVENVLQTLLFTHHLKFRKIPEGYSIMK